MPTFQYNCETCGAERRAWRPPGHPPKFCSRRCAARGSAGISRRPTRWSITPEIHEMIQKAYQTMSGNGQINQLAARLGYPRWKITRYAVKQGWVATQPKEPNWGGQEIDILERKAHLSPERIQIYLRRAEFNRSVTAIVLKRKRMRLPKNLAGMSACQLAECLGVDSHFVTRAIRDGRLRAIKRGTDRTSQQGGDIYFIKGKQIKEYIIGNIHEIDLRKVDKFWFVDVLTA
jgi:hypothetical protein